jgi:flavin-binding protein dodecin
LEDLRIAEVVSMDVHIENGSVLAYRVKMKLSFKYHESKAVEGKGLE